MALVLTITVVPLAVFLWLGWKLTQQDHAIERQQRRERLQLAADKVIAAVDRAISASEQALAAGKTDWPDGAVAVTFADDRIAVAPPGRLAYLPSFPPCAKCRRRPSVKRKRLSSATGIAPPPSVRTGG